MSSIFKKVLILLVLPLFINAQSQNFTIEDVVLNSYSKLAPDNLRQLNWIDNTDLFYYYSEDQDGLVIRSATNLEESNIVKLELLNSHLSSSNFGQLKRFPSITWISRDSFRFWNGDSLFNFDVKSKVLELLNSKPNNAENLEFAGDNKTILYTIGQNLFIGYNSDEHFQITADTLDGILNGQTVHRSEFGISDGIFISPKSNFTAFYRKDESMVTNYPLVDLKSTPAVLENIRYPMAGQTSELVTLGIFNHSTKSTIWLNTGDPKDKYLTSVTWSPDEENIFVGILNRDQNHLILNKYSVETGDLVKTLFEEKHEKYVEPEHPLHLLEGSENDFIWISERDGYDHLYHYNTDGTLINQVTKGDWVITDYLGSDENNNLYFEGTKESPLERHLYKVDLDGSSLTKITNEAGTHNIKLNSDKSFALDTYSSTETPRKISLINTDGDLIVTLLESDNPYSEYNLGEMKIFSIEGDEKIELYSRIIFPPDFDESKKYPVIVYVYGGPHVQLVTNSWPGGRYHLWFQYMAQKGFIVFTLDSRGSANRGRDFEQATFRRLGTFEVEDQLTGVKYLKSLPYVDSDRIGVFGWSYGGFMTTSLMTRTNNAFKVGVGGGAVIDWKFYEVMYTERYMDTPQTNPDGYKEASLLSYVENLKGKLLLVHGTKDPVVVWQNSLKFAELAANKNIPLDYYPYIGHPHGVGGKDAVHLYSKISNYFIENL